MTSHILYQSLISFWNIIFSAVAESSSTRQVRLPIILAVCLIVCGLVVMLMLLVVNKLYHIDERLVDDVRRVCPTCCSSVSRYVISDSETDESSVRRHRSTRGRFQSVLEPWWPSLCTLRTDLDESRLVTTERTA